jgi:hypothetical protein
MDDQKQQLIDRIEQAKNILVTVSTDPSIDQLAACLGLTIWLNKIGKHATAVFSGEVPSTLEFLQPAETLEKNTDSLRDFIIALDKSKADKLRYKVEDNVVKIFITPYRTSLSADDLEFSQGDFNVDVVIALGVAAQADLDTAITAHGRILHDATVATITTGDAASELGSISWHNPQVSSLSELVTNLGDALDKAQLDGQIATALLTGIVAETDRFSNEKTTPQTMNVSAQLMGAGANQQLVASKLEEPPEPPIEPEPAIVKDPEPAAEPDGATPPPADGTIQIDHPDYEEPTAPAEDSSATESEFNASALPPVAEPSEPAEAESIPEPETRPDQTTEPASAEQSTNEPPEADEQAHSHGKIVIEPPKTDDQPTPEELLDEAAADLAVPAAPDTVAPAQPDQQFQPAPPDWLPPQPWMNGSASGAPTEPTSAPVEPTPAAVTETAQTTEAPETEEIPVTPPPTDTLADIEQSVQTGEAEPAAGAEPAPVDAARDKVMEAINSVPDPNPAPIEALNAHPIDLETPTTESAPTPDQPSQPTGQVPVPDQPAQSLTFDPSAFEVANDAELAPPKPIGTTAAPEPVAPAPELTDAVQQPFTLPVPASLTPPPADPVPPTSTENDPAAPPPVPPPLMPPNYPPGQ